MHSNRYIERVTDLLHIYKTDKRRVKNMIDEKKNIKQQKVQNLILENREKLSISGVIDVESFNDECVIVDTELGVLTIKGEDLHINKLNLDNSELDIEGDICLLEYSDREGGKSGGFWAKMFK